MHNRSLPAPLNWLCCLATLAASLNCGTKLSWSNVGSGARAAGMAGAAGTDGVAGAALSDAGAAGAAGATPGGAGTVGAGGATGDATTGSSGAMGGGGSTATGGQEGVGSAQVKYAGTIVNAVNSGNEVIFRRIDPSRGLCLLVDVFIQVGGQISGPRSAYALPTDTAGCLTATTASRVVATGSSGAINSQDQGTHFNIDLTLFFPSGMDWLPPSVAFKAMNLPLDGVWYPGP